MNSQPKPPHNADNPLINLQGSIERVTFHSESSGFCVLRINVKGYREVVVTMIGSAASVTAGEYVECLGFWINDRQHGQQFKTTVLKVVAPTTVR
jgi:exodeoxyribonuclease V alpha subunit